MNVRPGDRAICIAGPFEGEQCDIVSGGGGFTLLATSEWMDGWIVAFDQPMPWSDPSPRAPDMNEGWYPDKWLRPIRPDAAPESITTDEVLEVGA